jgi:uncharacterized peroxidase-related enzyme
MPRIAWVEDAEVQGNLAEIVARIRQTHGASMPDIIRTMSLRPDFLSPIMEAIRSLMRNPGALTSLQREMIASYVSALTRCQYCVVTHTGALRSAGGEYDAVADALLRADLDRAPVTRAERLLLEFVGTLTWHAYRITDEQVQGLRDAGWTDSQVAEAAYTGALFNMLVRLADAFGIRQPGDWDPDATPMAVPSEEPRGGEIVEDQG